LATVKVPADQLSLAIGKGGQNVRLAAKLTNWKITIAEESGRTVADSEVGEFQSEVETPETASEADLKEAAAELNGEPLEGAQIKAKEEAEIKSE